MKEGVIALGIRSFFDWRCTSVLSPMRYVQPIRSSRIWSTAWEMDPFVEKTQGLEYANCSLLDVSRSSTGRLGAWISRKDGHDQA